ncbi:hypothetical protein [Luethyella okanaganae]|uniref:Helix-turn-helix domain-containing protein n=1 Tax=Luethyella okanaganae TaxID=69372 RepID=A0ABW1VAG3_9MICO
MPLSSSTRAALERLLSLETADASADGLERLRAIRSLQLALDAEPATLSAVREALADGADWNEIAEAAGLKAAAAKNRWYGGDAEIAARREASRKRSARPSAKPTGLPGLSVAEAAERLGVSVQAVYLRVTRGTLRAETVEVPDGRTYKRVFLSEDAAE